METVNRLLARQNPPDNPDTIPDGWVIDDDGVARPWWYSRQGYIVKWSIFFGLILLVGLYLLLGYLHAKARVRKGLVPLYYHRWLVSKAELASVDPRYAYPQSTFRPYYPPPPQYSMYPTAPPPVYEPPAGATKADPSQFLPADVEAGQRPVSGFAPPPPGPPPAAGRGGAVSKLFSKLRGR